MNIGLLVFIIVFSIILVLFVGLILTGFFIIRGASHTKYIHQIADSYKDNPQPEFEFAKDLGWFNQEGFFAKERITSYDHKHIEAYFHKELNHNYLIFAHGYTGSPEEKSKCLHMLYDKYKCNMLVMKQRAHGNSEIKYVTMGHREGKDLLSWIDFIVNSDSEANITVFGESMGAATVLYGLDFGYPKNVKCIIEDCGYTNIPTQYEFTSRSIGIPKLVTKIGVFGCTLAFFFIFHMNVYHHSPLHAIKKESIPICFIHGDKDQTVPYECFLTFKKKINKNTKAIFKSFKDARHCGAFYTENERYMKIITSFIDEHCFKN